MSYRRDTLANAFVRRALEKWALARLRQDGDPDVVRGAISDIDSSLTIEEAKNLIVQAARNPSGQNDIYWVIASQLDPALLEGPVQEAHTDEQARREEVLSRAKFVREELEEAVREGLITRDEAEEILGGMGGGAGAGAEVQLAVADITSEINRLRTELREMLREYERMHQPAPSPQPQQPSQPQPQPPAQQPTQPTQPTQQTMEDRLRAYITETMNTFHIPPSEAFGLYSEIHPELSYEQNRMLIDERVREILEEMDMEMEEQKRMRPSAVESVYSSVLAQFGGVKRREAGRTPGGESYGALVYDTDWAAEELDTAPIPSVGISKVTCPGGEVEWSGKVSASTLRLIIRGALQRGCRAQIFEAL